MNFILINKLKKKINIDGDYKHIKQKSFLNVKNIGKFDKAIDNYYYQLSPIIFKDFNSFHKTNFEKKQLEILIGYLIRRLISILYEKWLTVKFFKNKKNDNYFFQEININTNFKNCYDTIQFFKLFKNSLWNYKVYMCILNFLEVKNIKKLKGKKNKIKLIKLKETNNYINFIKIKINNFFFKLLKGKSFFFYCLGFSKINELYLNIKYNNLPIILFPIKRTFFSTKIHKKRNFNYKRENSKNFKNFFLEFYKEYAPSIYYEDFHADNFYGYCDLTKKKIYTSIGHYYDFDFNKNLSLSKNYKLNIIQHGGDNFFLKLKSDFFKHDYNIANKYLSFTKNLPRLKKVYQLKKVSKSANNKLNLSSKIIKEYVIVLPPLKNYTQFDISSLLNNNVIDRTKKLILILRKNNKKFKVKFFSKDDDIILKKRIPRLNKNEITNKSLLKSKDTFYILTYFGTPVYELLELNSPFTVFVNKSFLRSFDKSFATTINYMHQHKLLNYYFNDINFLTSCKNSEVCHWWNSQSLNKIKKKCLVTFSNGFKSSLSDIK